MQIDSPEPTPGRPIAPGLSYELPVTRRSGAQDTVQVAVLRILDRQAARVYRTWSDADIRKARRDLRD